MITLFRSVFELFRLKRIYVDNTVFRLHYKVTFGALICFSIVVSCYEFFGSPIRCITTKDIRQAALETFCWAHSTFSVPEAFFKKYGEEVSYPGIANSKNKDRVFHKYYQWVCFFLILQALLFFLPHHIWKAYESGRMKQIVLNLDLPVMEKETKSENIRRLVQYMKSNLKYHTRYFMMHVICEVLNFINTIGQLYLIDTFLGHAFMKFGIKLLQYEHDDDENNVQPSPLTIVFPKMAKCIFHYGGSGGDVQKYDTACVLPLNVINEKIYVFLWFWLILLAAITGFSLVYRFLQIFSYHFRFLIIRFKCKEVNSSDLDIVLNRCNISDWFVLNLLGKNLERNNFKDFMNALARELEQNGYKKLLDMYNGTKLKDASV